MVVVVVASMILVAAGSWTLCSRARRAWNQRRALGREAARGIARLEIMLQERADTAGPSPGRREGDTGSDTSASNPQIS
jgi:hypothetical protein